MASLNKQTKRLLLLGLFVLLLAACGLLFFFQSYIRNQLSDQVKERLQTALPDGYFIDYDSFEIDWTAQSLDLTAFKLNRHVEHLDGTKVSLMIPEMSIRLHSVWEAFIDRSLRIEEIIVGAPTIQVESSHEGPNEKGLTNTSFNLLEVLGNYLFSIEVENIALQKAGISYKSDDGTALVLSEVDLFIEQFRVDSTQQKQDIFNAKGINLRIAGDRFELGDGFHWFSFDDCTLSTEDSSLVFNNLHFRPIADMMLSADFYNESPLFDIKAPQIVFQGIDFQSSYINQNFAIQSLLLDAPEIIYRDVDTGPRKVKDLSEETALDRLLEQLSPQINIEQIILQNAKLNLDFEKTRSRLLSLDIDSIVLHDFELNAETLLFDTAQFPFRDLELSLSNVRQKLGGDLTEINFSDVFLSTINKRIDVQDIFVGNPDNKAKVSIQIPRLSLEGLDIFEVLLDNRIDVQQLSIYEPFTAIQLDSNEVDSTVLQEAPLERVAHFFQNFFIKEIKAAQIHIHDGRFQLDSLLQIGSYHYTGSRILLNEKATQWEKIIPQYQLSAKDITYQIDPQQISVDSLFTDGDDLHLDQCALHFNFPTDSIDISIPALVLKSINMDSLLRSQIWVDSLLVLEPVITYEQRGKAERREQQELPLQMGFLQVENAQLQYRNIKKDEFQLADISLQGHYRQQLEIEDIDFKSFAYLPIAGTHRVKWEQGRINWTDQLIDLNKIELQPIPNRSIQDSTIRIERLRLEGFDLEQFQQNQAFHINKIALERPDFHWHLEASSKEDTAQKISLPDFVIDTLLLLHTDLEVKQKKDSSQINIRNSTVAAYDLNSDQLMQRQPFFSGLLFESQQGLNYRNNAFALRFGPLLINSNLGLMQTNYLEYIPLQSSPIQHLSFEEISLNGIPSNGVLFQDSLHMEGFNIQGGKLIWDLDHQRSDTSEQQLRFPKLSIDKGYFGDFDVQLLRKRDIHIKGVHMEFDSLSLDSSTLIRDLDGAFSQFDFSLDSLYFNTGKNQEHDLGMSMSYSSLDRALRIHQLQLEKVYPDSIFQAMLPYRQDYWSISSRMISLDSIYLRTFLQDTFWFPKIKVDGLWADNYNDETKPLAQGLKAIFTEQIKTIDRAFRVDSLHLSGDLRYTAPAPLSKEISWITIDDIDAKVANISNISQHWKQPLSLEAHAKLYDQAAMRINMQFDLSSPIPSFEMQGNIKAFDLPKLNPMLQPQAAIQINRGQNRSIIFNLAANDTIAVGDLLFRYRKLNIQLLNKEDPQHSGFGNSILSFWANRLVSSNNPSWLRRRKGTIYFRRDQQKGIAHFWVHSILSGVVSSVGIKNTKRKMKKSGINNTQTLNYEALFKDQLKKERKAKSKQ